MKSSLVEILCCPACRYSYNIRIQKQSSDAIETAILTCPNCCISVPVLRGFPLFQEQFLTATPDLSAIDLAVFGTPQEYESFLSQKRQKPVYDLYAAFQPFNESTRAIFPLLPLLRELLSPGDLILDLWCRTGWSGELLAASFPEQQIISVWEGHSGLLGPKGFDYWLGSGKRHPNLDIIFHSPNDPLPFAGGVFPVVHGLDTLHRYHHVPLISECLRVTNRRQGAIVFPHVHLTNSEPEPFFERGEDQMHGLEYRDYFARLFQDTGWKGFVLSEQRLFDAGNSYTLADEPETSHYNACILLAPQSHDRKIFDLEAKDADQYKDAYLIVNPLYSIDLVRREAVPAPEAMDGGGETLFFRHPIYHQRLMRHSPVTLELRDCLILYWALRLKTVSQIAGLLRMSVKDTFERIRTLEQQELVHVQNISSAMAKLQSYYSTQRATPTDADATLSALWKRSTALHGDKPFIVWPQDESIFTYQDADTIARMSASFLRSKGVEKGNRVMVEAVSHPEFVFLFWAAILTGAVIVPFSSELNSQAFSALVDKTSPSLILHNSAKFHIETACPAVQFAVAEDSSLFHGSFSNLVAEQPLLDRSPQINDSDDAVILFTSGSTGAPKGVVLTHGALHRSSAIVDEAYKWKDTDRFLSGGSFHTMSGLRNPCIVALHSGASVIIPGADNLQNPLSVMQLCMQHRASILNVTPPFLAYWSRAAQKARYFAGHNLRMVLSTGSALNSEQRFNFQKLFDCPVYDYYGLTETTGACIIENELVSDVAEKGIGRPWGCIVDIVDESGKTQPAGCTGELAIYSDNLMRRYLDDPAATEQRIRDGWLMTGDTARINRDGCVVLVGRRDRMMIDKNGENIYPEEIEQALSRMENVSDCFVTQYRDAYFVDQIAALVRFQDAAGSEQQAVAQLRTILAQQMPAHRVPSLIVSVADIPRGPSGKASAEAIQQIIRQELKR